MRSPTSTWPSPARSSTTFTVSPVSRTGSRFGWRKKDCPTNSSAINLTLVLRSELVFRLVKGEELERGDGIKKWPFIVHIWKVEYYSDDIVRNMLEWMGTKTVHNILDSWLGFEQLASIIDDYAVKRVLMNDPDNVYDEEQGMAVCRKPLETLRISFANRCSLSCLLNVDIPHLSIMNQSINQSDLSLIAKRFLKTNTLVHWYLEHEMFEDEFISFFTDFLRENGHDFVLDRVCNRFNFNETNFNITREDGKILSIYYTRVLFSSVLHLYVHTPSEVPEFLPLI